MSLIMMNLTTAIVSLHRYIIITAVTMDTVKCTTEHIMLCNRQLCFVIKTAIMLCYVMLMFLHPTVYMAVYLINPSMSCTTHSD